MTNHKVGVIVTKYKRQYFASRMYGGIPGSVGGRVIFRHLVEMKGDDSPDTFKKLNELVEAEIVRLSQEHSVPKIWGMCGKHIIIPKKPKK